MFDTAYPTHTTVHPDSHLAPFRTMPILNTSKYIHICIRLYVHLCHQGRNRDLHGGFGGAGDGPSIDLAGTRTVKEILRVVNAKRMGATVSRRFSATMDPASPAAAAAAVADPTTSAGSAAPAAAAPAAAAPAAPASALATARGTGAVGKRQTANDGDNDRGGSGGALVDEHSAPMPLLGSRNPFESTVVPGEGGKRGKIEAAADLLARVKGQLERSEQRTKRSPDERQGISDIAPPR